MVWDTLIQSIEQVVGAAGLVRDPELMHSYLTDWRNAYQGRAALVVRPATTEEVAAVVRHCHDARVGLVPPGDRKSVGEGKSESVRVKLGVRRVIKKKKKE